MEIRCCSIDRVTSLHTPAACLAVVLIMFGTSAQAADCCGSSWVFKRSTYTHAPETGARVAQYDRHVPVEELPDPRLVTSGYRRTRINLRGADGSVDSSYQVQNWGNGRGGLDSEWERFHDAWRQSSISGGYYNSGAPYGSGYGPGVGFPGGGYGPGFGAPGYGPGVGFPGAGGNGFAPAYGYQPGWHPQPLQHHGHSGGKRHSGEKRHSDHQEDE
ncbi:MAG: hypothetical protein ACR2NU_09210 [Aeoliella sp.]